MNDRRKCPNCKKTYNDKNVTTCLECGYPTEALVVTKGTKRKVKKLEPIKEETETDDA